MTLLNRAATPAAFPEPVRPAMARREYAKLSSHFQLKKYFSLPAAGVPANGEPVGEFGGRYAAALVQEGNLSGS